VATTEQPAVAQSDSILARHTFVGPDGRKLHVYGELRGRPGRDWPPVQPAALQQRHDRLTASWVAISPARNTRPHASDDPTGVSCPLCPGGPEVPFSYDAAAFDNRFPTFLDKPGPVPDLPGLRAATGRCEVVLYTEGHSGSLATLSTDELARVVAIWIDRTAELWADTRHAFVMAFENRGEAVGATLSHPHGQIYAFDHVPPFIATRVAALEGGRGADDSCLTCEVVAEDAASERLIGADEHFVVAVPFAPRWPLEVHVRARRHGLRRLSQLSTAESVALAGALRSVVLRYDGLFDAELAYMMVALEAPAAAADWHLAFEFMPPQRSERLLKVRASVETATGLFINDSLPEASAARLAAVPIEARTEQAAPNVIPAPATRIDQ
jgi:UDPglucose--hexose-1-phosphate uridylyltransferase